MKLNHQSSQTANVLILVLVEYTLEAEKLPKVDEAFGCLNPCFSGIYSRRSFKIIAPRYKGGLNPCFSGIYSRRVKLVKLSDNDLPVLILVLVEYTLEVLSPETEKLFRFSLNPCFSGIYSRSPKNFQQSFRK